MVLFCGRKWIVLFKLYFPSPHVGTIGDSTRDKLLSTKQRVAGTNDETRIAEAWIIGSNAVVYARRPYELRDGEGLYWLG